MVSHDRLGLFRPLRNKNNRLVKSRREKWKTAYSLHWDVSTLLSMVVDSVCVDSAIFPPPPPLFCLC